MDTPDPRYAISAEYFFDSDSSIIRTHRFPHCSFSPVGIYFSSLQYFIWNQRLPFIFQ
ncbi:hypothetical protein K439DRAFT_1638278 [Ramaria rubella]|nr:hypothetical protein K439DRAFT_1641675 [Ramaria rubella]KAF8579122.1 hypothetical protein K439DRAFT_1638278 [Ramaria rubella]